MNFKRFLLVFSTSLLVGWFNFASGQIDEVLLKHFVENKQDSEHLTYLKTVSISEDSMHFFNAKFYCKSKKWQEFYNEFQKITSDLKVDSNFLELATIQILGLKDSLRNVWFEKEVPKHPFLKIYDSIFTFSQTTSKQRLLVPEPLQQSLSNSEKANRKSPIMAAALSTLIPGLGKVYLGNYRTGLFSLFTISVFGIQTVESYQEKGLEHLLTITNAGFFTAYYVTNIVGSFREAKQKKEEFRNQFLIDASVYYSRNFDGSLY
jgi:hypothetical protein